MAAPPSFGLLRMRPLRCHSPLHFASHSSRVNAEYREVVERRVYTVGWLCAAGLIGG